MIVFETPGWLDMRAITTFGLNAKPNSKSPIGHFGTGLKYALAVLLREGHEVAIIVGNRRWDFEYEQKEFRGEMFGHCNVITPGWLPLNRKKEQLPFTTDLGKHWKMWQSFRELFSNTLDENGLTYEKPDDWTPPKEESRTFILVKGEAFTAEFEARWSNFLENGIRDKVSGVQILPRESNVVYYRGVRIMELQKPSLFTYNILSAIDLTEDRTAKYPFQVEGHVKTAWIQHENRQWLQEVLNAEDDSWEAKLDFESTYYTPSEAFSLAGSSGRNRSARKMLRYQDEAWVQAQKAKHYTERLAEFITDGEWDKFLDLAQENQDELYKLLMALRPSSWEPDADMITINPEFEDESDTGSPF